MKKGGSLTIEQESILREKGAHENMIRNLKILPNSGYNAYIAEIVKGYNNKIVKDNNNKIINLKLIFTMRNVLNKNLKNRDKVIEYKYTFNTINSLIKNIKEIIGEDNIIANIMYKHQYVYNVFKNTFRNTVKNNTLKNNDILNILSYKRLNPKELAKYIINEKSGVEKISMTKPVATLNSSVERSPFSIMWQKYSEEEHENLKDELSKIIGIKINIFIKEKESSPIFYSEEFFPILGDVYGYDLQEAFNVINGTANNNKKRDFIYTSFGDTFENNIENNNQEFIVLTNNGQKKFDQYFNMCSGIIRSL